LLLALSLGWLVLAVECFPFSFGEVLVSEMASFAGFPGGGILLGHHFAWNLGLTFPFFVLQLQPGRSLKVGIVIFALFSHLIDARALLLGVGILLFLRQKRRGLLVLPIARSDIIVLIIVGVRTFLSLVNNCRGSVQLFIFVGQLIASRGVLGSRKHVAVARQ